MATPIIKMSGINNMRGSGGNSDMTPHDRHAQAAMIMSMVERVVDVYGQAYLKAQYGRELNGGEQADKVREILVRCVMAAMPTGVHSSRGVSKLITIYFGGKITMVSVRTDFRCKMATSFEYRNLAFSVLDKIHANAEAAIHAELEKAGLIDVEVTA